MVKIPFNDLKSLFVKHGFSNSDVAKKVNLSQSTLSNRMTAKSEFRAGEIYMISKMLDISEDQYASYFILPYLVFHGIA